jgi:V/A-type H+-transporting ATPase subunit E
MEVQLQELIDRIRNEGIDSAKTEAERIVAEARAEAASIVAAARKEATRTADQARAEAERARDAGEAALRQASRNLLLAFRKRLEAMLGAIAKQEAAQAMNDDMLATLIPEVVKAWLADGSKELAIELPPDRAARLESRMAGLLKSELGKGIEIRPLTHLDAGFRIQNRSGALRWDFSAEELARLLAQFVNPRLAALLEEAAREPQA